MISLKTEIEKSTRPIELLEDGFYKVVLESIEQKENRVSHRGYLNARMREVETGKILFGIISSFNNYEFLKIFQVNDYPNAVNKIGIVEVKSNVFAGTKHNYVSF